MQLFLKKVAFSFRNYREFPVILVKQGKMNRELNIAMDEAMLLRYFSGVLENEEKEQVETWISLSEENRKTAKQILYLYRATDVVQTLSQVDAKKALVKVDKRLSKRMKRGWWEWTMRVAAILSIPLLISSLYFFFSQAADVDQYVEIRANPGMISQITLPDGSQVWLNSASYLKYPVRFTESDRQVELEGEAYFSVRKDAGRRFLVNVGDNVQLEVLGTEFNVDAYPKDDFVAASLVTGKVNFHCRQQGQETVHMMIPGQKVVYDFGSEKLVCTDTSIESDIAWKSGKIIFRDTPIEDALRILSKRFEVDFQLTNSLLKEYCFTGTFIDQRLDRILEHFKIASGIKYKYIETTRKGEEVVKGKSVIEIY